MRERETARSSQSSQVRHVALPEADLRAGIDLDARRALVPLRGAPHLPTEERVAAFGRPAIVAQLDSLPLENFQQEFDGRFVDESCSLYPYDVILPCTTEELVLADDFTDLPFPEGRIVAGFDVGRTGGRCS